MLFFQLSFDQVFPRTEVPNAITRTYAFESVHESSPNLFERLPARYLYERDNVPKAGMAVFFAGVGGEQCARVTGNVRGHMIHAYFLAGSLEAFELNGKVYVGDVDTTKRISFLEEVTRQYVKDVAVVLDHLFLRACHNQPSVFNIVQKAFPETENC